MGWAGHIYSTAKIRSIGFLSCISLRAMVTYPEPSINTDEEGHMDLSKYIITADNITGVSLRKLCFNTPEISVSVSDMVSSILWTWGVQCPTVRYRENGKTVSDWVCTPQIAEWILEYVGVDDEEGTDSEFTDFPSSEIEQLAAPVQAPESTPSDIEKPPARREENDNRVNLEWEIIQKLIEKGNLTATETDRLLREFYERTTGRTLPVGPSMEYPMHGTISLKAPDPVPVKVEISPVLSCDKDTISSVDDYTFPEDFPEGYGADKSNPFGEFGAYGTGHFVVYNANTRVGSTLNLKEAIKMAWNHHDKINDPPGFQCENHPVATRDAFGTHHSQEVHFTMPGEPKRRARDLATARVSAWRTYRSKKNREDASQTTPSREGGLITVSELAEQLGEGIYPQTIGDAISAASAHLGIDIRTNDRYTQPLYAGGRDVKGRAKYLLTPAGCTLIKGYLRKEGKIQ